jgi:hypothetical protein
VEPCGALPRKCYYYYYSALPLKLELAHVNDDPNRSPLKGPNGSQGRHGGFTEYRLSAWGLLDSTDPVSPRWNLASHRDILSNMHHIQAELLHWPYTILRKRGRKLTAKGNSVIIRELPWCCTARIQIKNVSGRR